MGGGVVKMSPSSGGDRAKKSPPVDRFDQTLGKMSSGRGKLAYHMGIVQSYSLQGLF